MRDILAMELLKLKGQRILWLSPVCALITVMIGYVEWHGARNTYGEGVNWDYLFPMVEQVSTYGLVTVFISFFSVFIFLNEQNNFCTSEMFMYPHRRFSYLCAKLCVVFLMCGCTYLIIFLMTFVSGSFILGGPPYLWLLRHHVKIFVIAMLLIFSFSPLAILLGNISRSSILPLVTIVIILLWNSNLSRIVLQNVDVNVNLLPWNATNRIIESLQNGLNPAYTLAKIYDYTPYVISLLITSILPLLILVFQFILCEGKGIAE